MVKQDKTNISQKVRRVFLYYATFLSTFLIIGGFASSTNSVVLLSNLLFVPVVVVLWWMLISLWSGKNKQI